MFTHRPADPARTAYTHGSASEARLCETAYVGPCDWLVDGGFNEDGERVIEDCGADAWDTGRGWKCAAGHGHVNADVRAREGWDYAEDEEEATLLRRQGVGAVPVGAGWA